MDYLKPLYNFDFLKTLIHEGPTLKLGPSLPIVLLTMISADCIRQYLMSLYFVLPFIIPLLLDAVVAFEYFIMAFELGVISEEHGFWCWMFALFASILYQCLRWQGLSMPSPCVFLQEYFFGKTSLMELFLRTVIVACSGFIAFYGFTLPLWERRNHPLIKARIGALNGTTCLMDLDEMSIYAASITEFTGTIILSLSPALVVEHPSLFVVNPLLNACIIAIIVCVIVAAAFNISGGFFNPVLAMVTFHNCKSFNYMNHFLIYWIPGILGATVAYNIYPRARTYIYDFFDIILRREKKWYQSPFVTLNKTHYD